MIPFNRPTLAGPELDSVREAISLGQLAGDGAFTKRCQRWLAEKIDAPAVLLTHSCTAALEMAAILLDLQPGDEVIMPSFTFVSTANAVVLRGAVPVFVDIRPDTLNIDERLVEAAVTDRTKAITVVHYAGVPAEMDTIIQIAQKYNLTVVEDAAQALGSFYKGRPAGSFGCMAAFSFHETKNVISGEGGCLAICDEKYLERAEILREKGTNRRRFLRGQVDKYSWVDIGSSYLPGELIASFLYGQLQMAGQIEADRMKVWQAYDRHLRRLSNRSVGLPFVPLDCKHNAHMYYLTMPTANLRDEMIQRMRQDGIMTPFHYVPLHSSEAGRRFGRPVGDLSFTNSLSSRLLRLPLFPQMNGAHERVIDRIIYHAEHLL